MINKKKKNGEQFFFEVMDVVMLYPYAYFTQQVLQTVDWLMQIQV